MLRAVVDVNVLVSSAIGRRGPPWELYRRWRSGEFEILVSTELLDELESVLTRRRIAAYADPTVSRELVSTLRANAIAVEPSPPHDRSVERDRDDDYLVALAVEGRAHVIVTGDRHLLELEELVPRVLTPAAFLGLLERIG